MTWQFWNDIPQRNWTVTQYNTSSITYSLLDPSGTQGFPGAVVRPVRLLTSLRSGRLR